RLPLEFHMVIRMVPVWHAFRFRVRPVTRVFLLFFRWGNLLYRANPQFLPTPSCRVRPALICFWARKYLHTFLDLVPLQNQNFPASPTPQQILFFSVPGLG